MKKVLSLITILMLGLIFTTQSFAVDAIFNRNKPDEIKGFSIFVADDDIDTAYQLMTDLDTTYAQLTAEDNIEIVSSSSADITQSITVTGIDNAGKQVKETIALNTTDGTTAVTSTNTFRYIDQVSTNIVCAGTITVRKATGDTFIISIPAGSMEGMVVQHFNGEKNTYLTGWAASVTSTTGTVTYNLLWYPDEAKCLAPGTGMATLDTITLTNALGESQHPLPNIKLTPGGWLAVMAIGGSANADGTVRIEGYDSSN
ncbi:MAG: hypothetical protein PHY56_00885 [Candidatus Omnitrophica bacterium]|nr:hypothetical protein [Candidatus Omnitrophota bacterium]